MEIFCLANLSMDTDSPNNSQRQYAHIHATKSIRRHNRRLKSLIRVMAKPVKRITVSPRDTA